MTTSTVTGDTPWRETGGTTLEGARAEIARCPGSPLAFELDEIVAVAGRLSRLVLAMSWMEQKHATWESVARTWDNHNYLSVTAGWSTSGVRRWASYGSFRAATVAWLTLLTDPIGPYRDTVTIRDLIAVYAPKADHNDEAAYVANVVAVVDRLPGAVATAGTKADPAGITTRAPRTPASPAPVGTGGAVTGSGTVDDLLGQPVIPHLACIWSGYPAYDAATWWFSQGYGLTEWADSAAGRAMYAYSSAYTRDGAYLGHPGVDVGMAKGTNAYSLVEGTVTKDGGERYFYDVEDGYNVAGSGWLEIRTPSGVLVTYGHMHTVGVRKGAKIALGQWVGTVGTFNGGHIHLEVRVPDAGCASGYRDVDPLTVWPSAGIVLHGPAYGYVRPNGAAMGGNPTMSSTGPPTDGTSGTTTDRRIPDFMADPDYWAAVDQPDSGWYALKRQWRVTTATPVYQTADPAAPHLAGADLPAGDTFTGLYILRSPVDHAVWVVSERGGRVPFAALDSDGVAGLVAGLPVSGR